MSAARSGAAAQAAAMLTTRSRTSAPSASIIVRMPRLRPLSIANGSCEIAPSRMTLRTAGLLKRTSRAAMRPASIFGTSICLVLLIAQLLPRDQFDVWALLQRWNKRRQYRDLVSKGFNPFEPTAGRGGKGAAPDPVMDRVHEIRGQISDALSKNTNLTLDALGRQTAVQDATSKTTSSVLEARDTQAGSLDGLSHLSRSAENMKPEAGRTMACPKRMMSICVTHWRISGCARERSLRIASFQ